MPNPIKYTTGSETNALKKGNFYIGTGDVDKGPTNITGYYNGVSPVEGGYTIYIRKPDAAGELSYHSATNDEELISFTNGLVGATYTTVEQCFLYYNTQSDKVCFNRDYEGIVTDGLVLNLDAGFIPSYPRGGTSWGDLSGNDNNGTLINSPSYTSDNLGALNFDGTNSSITIPFDQSMDFSQAQTICMWLKPVTGSNSSRRNPYNQAYGGSGTLTHEPNQTINYYFGTHGGNSTPYVGRNSGFTVAPNELAFITVTRSQPLNLCRWYKNGQAGNFDNAGGYSSTNNGSSPILIANGYTSRFLGEIYNVFIYNRYMTQDEVQQMYNATKGRYGL